MYGFGNGVPTKVSFLQGKRIVAVACGEYHTIVLDDTRTVYGFGLCEDGQLGPKSPSLVQRVPKPIPKLDHLPVIGVVAGFDRSGVITLPKVNFLMTR